MSGFSDLDWRAVGRRLRFVGKRWWAEHREQLTGLAEDEARDLFAALARGDRRAAKLEMVARMTPEQWAAYRDGTTAELQGIADRRAQMLDALKELGWLAARAIGAAALQVVG